LGLGQSQKKIIKNKYYFMTTSVKNSTKRIEYIDAMRGFTMILVVFSHIEGMLFKDYYSFVNQVFMSFRMPLFFFISGLVTKLI
jgi:peptidoglycan/LPS O-acetylase OafA/YrhL